MSKHTLMVKLTDIAVINRQRKTLQAIDELAASIKSNGLINPITVRPVTEAEREAGHKQPYALKTGGRRLAAHILLERPEIEATVWTELTALQQEEIELDENLRREGITWQEEVAAKARIHEIKKLANPTQTQAQTAELIGEDRSNLTIDLQLAEMIKKDPSLKEETSKKAARRKAQFKDTVARKVAAVSRTDTTELHRSLKTMDMRDYLRLVPDSLVDLSFSDLPFGINYDRRRVHEASESLHLGAYDDSTEKTRDLLTDAIPHFLRITKPDGWVAFFMADSNYSWLRRLVIGCCKTHAEYVQTEWREDDKEVMGEWFRKSDTCKKGMKVLGPVQPAPCLFFTPEEPRWYWYRPNSRSWGRYPDRHAANRLEPMLIAGGPDSKLMKHPVGNVLNYDSNYEDRYHEMQKPIPLCVEVIERLTLPGELVLDACFGSGAHLAAARASGRRYMGCDADPANLDSAVAHISENPPAALTLNPQLVKANAGS